MGRYKNDEAFTGLEAAIVLIAFVVTASVFSYVMLGAGFFATQKTQEVVYTSVGQASSSVEVLGDVYGNSLNCRSLLYYRCYLSGLADSIIINGCFSGSLHPSY